MVFSSTLFLFLFLPIVLIIYYNPFFKSRNFRNNSLFIMSLFFYAWGEPFCVFLMLFAIITAYFAGIKIDKYNNLQQKKKSKKVLTAGISVFVLMLFIFKYATFTAGQLGLLLHKDFSFINIPLPIGISFFTFQLMSYVFDVYYEKVHAQKNILHLGLYVSLFPQLIAGPIVRYSDIAEQITERKEMTEDAVEGMKRFVFGLGKKVILADYLAVMADNIFGDPLMAMSAALAWLGAIAYTLQIYFDFSGYSDMAIGLGRMFGFKFAENFKYPYMAESVTDFWRRWHISLSSWFRDYVYIPLGGNRVTKRRWILNIFAVWSLTGIWHGANWTFLVWGLFHCAILILEKNTGIDKKLGAFSRVYTLAVVTVFRVIYRVPNMAHAVKYIGLMFGIGGEPLFNEIFWLYIAEGKCILIAACILSAPVYPWFLDKAVQRYPSARYANLALVAGIYLLSLVLTISSDYNPFIYFNF